jgi:hypothetical protein
MRATRASGCRSEWTTWTSCTSIASPPGWRSHFRPPICPGTSARCTFATLVRAVYNFRFAVKPDVTAVLA